MDFDRESILRQISEFTPHPSPVRPRLLFSADEVPELRRRAARHAGLLDRVRQRAATAMQNPGARVDPLMSWVSSAEGVTVAEAYVLTGDAAYADWAKQRVTALLAHETWFAHVHKGGCRVCDHCVGNTGAHVALIHDFLGDRYTPAETQAVVRGMRRQHLEKFLDGTGANPEWWFRRNMPSNWKIMTCGESGVAVCGFAEFFPEANEALARAAQGVLELLDDVPPEGDWGEGVGYWFHTLWMGLRFARALRRLTGGAVDLFRHPILQVTGDYLTQLTAPAGRVYNFADCDPELSDIMRETIVMLGVEQRRGDWLATARQAPAPTPLYLACDDPRIPDAPPTRRVAAFPTTGVATLRSGFGARDLFVGFKSGPSVVGHSHLDANSFFIEAGGQTLADEYAYWPQAHFQGFFDPHGPRWNFDGLATLGHSTLLIDGQGQTWGENHAGRLLEARDGGSYQIAAGEAAPAYPGLLRKFVRTIVLLPPDRLVIRDVVECEGERHAEWLLQYAGTIRTDAPGAVVENGGVTLAVVPFLANCVAGWRWADVTRTSVYQHSDSLQQVTRAIRYRSFGPLARAGHFEFLFGLRVNGAGAADWEFSGTPGAWQLRAAGGAAGVVRPEGDTLAVE